MISAHAIELATIPDVIDAIARGQPVLVLDDADRENEADLICAADRIDARTMALMIREGSGIVCLCIRPGKASELKLRPMVELNRSRYATAFTQFNFGLGSAVSWYIFAAVVAMTVLYRAVTKRIAGATA